MADAFSHIPRISYAQNFEDVRLWKAVGHLRDHIWVDVGAGHPFDLSVTRLFMERGWNGINCEPGPNFDALSADRPSDVNLAVAVTDHEGEVEFNIAWPHPDLSAIDLQSLRNEPVNVESWTVVRCPATTLATILDRHSGGNPIAFLKVDVEGAEREVLLGNDWDRYRPLVVVAESIEPGTHRPSFASWEPILLDAGYDFAVDDGLNRFYARGDHPELRDRLAAPVSPIDGFLPRPVLVREVGDVDARLSRALVERDRALEAAEARAVAAEATVGRLEADLVAVRASWSMRIGGRLVRALRPLRPLEPFVRRAVREVRWLRRRGRSRPTALRSRVDRMSRPGRPLGPSLPVRTTGDADPWERVRRRLLARRRSGPLLLDAAEWQEVSQLAARHGGLLELDRLAAIPVVAGRPPADGSRHALVIDARAIDLIPCGTRSHARSILREVLEYVPADVSVLTMGPLAQPGDRETERIDGVWDGDESVVGAFLQLAPFHHPLDDEQIRLVASPKIRSAGVFLDAIVGFHPEEFLRTPAEFFHYQFGLECLARFDRVLTLSGAAEAEAEALGLETARLLRTGAEPRPVAGDPAGDLGLPFDRWLLVVGNGLVHKNLAVGVMGALAAAARRRDDPGVVVVANVTPAQTKALSVTARALGLPADRLVLRSLIGDAQLDALMGRAEVVVVPSRQEGYSLPVVEAVERGTPVVVSDIAAHRELLGDGRWMFSVDDPDAVRRSIEWTTRRGTDRVLREQRRALAARVDPTTLARSVRTTVDWLCEGLSRRGARVEKSPVRPVVGPDHRPSLAKVCELEDFASPRFREVMREVLPHELLRFGPGFPDGVEWRKYWEVTMAVLAFGEAGLLDGSARFLGVGAGNEPTLFHLTRHARHVLATDLYLSEGWEESANATMLTDPGRHWPSPWEPSRLEVRHMDALHLDLPDGSFDGVFSSSSVEHFGERSDVERALDEIFRVLKPGGVLSLSTEFRISGPPPGFPGVLLFGADEIEDLFVGERDWSLLEPFDPSVSAATMATVVPFAEVSAAQHAKVDRLGGLWMHRLDYDGAPHIVLEHDGRVFTSFHLALRKHG
ncbi:MAG: FkbM family methyltransferase [Acidimicrobiia bacterium]|nr:FkbM family methyltransferase [Acidimicrobiia bacterium]